MAPFNLRELIGVLRRRWMLIAGVTLAAAALGFRWVTSTVPMYESEATIRLKDSRREMAGGLADGAMDGFAGRQVDPVLSQIEVLTSRAVATTVVDSTPALRMRTTGIPVSTLSDIWLETVAPGDSFGLIFRPGRMMVRGEHGTVAAEYGNQVGLGGVHFTVPARPKQSEGTLRVITRESAAGSLAGRLRVRPREHTDVVDIAYTNSDARLATTVVNRVVQIFQIANADAAQQQSIRRRKFLEGQLRYNDSVLQRARLDLSEFRARQRAYSTKIKFSTEQAGLATMQVQREQLDADRRMYGDLLRELRDTSRVLDDAQVGAIMSSPGMASNPVVSQLYSQLLRYQAGRDSLTTGKWGSSTTNPDVQRLDVMIRSTKAKLVGAVESYLGSLDSRIRSVDDLRARSAGNIPELSATEEEEAGLEEQVESARALVAQLRAEYERARLAEAVEVGQVEVVDLAVGSGKRIGTGPVRAMGFVVILGFLLGGAAALLLENLNTSIRRREQIRSTLGLPELAVIPRLPNATRAKLHKALRRGQRPPSNGTKPVSGQLVAFSDSHSIGAEAYRLLRTSLLFSHPSNALKTVLVTSPAPGDGKTTVAANVAVTFAQQGMRVLLVDCDLRRGRVHSLFGLSRDPGVTELLGGTAQLTQAVRPTAVEGLWVLPMGRAPEHPAELLGGRYMRKLIETLKEQYDIVLFDTAPVLAASDAAILAAGMDGTVLVLRAGLTGEEQAQLALDHLTSVGANLVGAVLNDPDAKLRSAGAYYYNEYYGAKD